jgi:hypothetical protein
MGSTGLDGADFHDGRRNDSPLYFLNK